MEIEAISDEWIRYGYRQNIQDLYLYLNPQAGVVKMRTNQTVAVYETYSLEVAQQLIARFKYLGAMDIGEKRKAQLGAISYVVDQQVIRLRLSTVGDYRGLESLVIRFLSPQVLIDYTGNFDYYTLSTAVTKQTGLFLFSGATGSGKTTLMYHLAQEIKGQVITIEDPVEIEQHTFLQLQVNEKIDQSYDQLIKLALRHRPDLLIIGEIRDYDTAKAAIRAALTGHQVFATIHAKSIFETLARLLELGCSQWEIDNTIKGIVYQSFRDNQPTLAFEHYVGQVG
ncbi:competence type IV pilus ATPase ComGA [uncultured Enterococcus sp.]|uniref:competence type IV pilus ATPase ComGA n=1 Tax=uncultured Enterococcus sp. TaxID=167972 RepID=UPI0025CCB11F|nr:competence type IV pilus ATPase ComGA [uncultured Enterococcus sp.]